MAINMPLKDLNLWESTPNVKIIIIIKLKNYLYSHCGDSVHSIVGAVIRNSRIINNIFSETQRCLSELKQVLQNTVVSAIVLVYVEPYLRE